MTYLTIIDPGTDEYDHAILALDHRPGDTSTIAQPEDGEFCSITFSTGGNGGTSWISRTLGLIAVEGGGDPDWYHLPRNAADLDDLDLVQMAFDDELQRV